MKKCQKIKFIKVVLRAEISNYILYNRILVLKYIGLISFYFKDEILTGF